MSSNHDSQALEHLSVRCGRSVVLAVPSYHGHVEFARLVRLLGERCDAVALEISDPLANSFVQELRKHAHSTDRWLPGNLAIARTPGGGGNLQIFPISPCDSICEGGLLGIATGKRIFGIDLDTRTPSKDKTSLQYAELCDDPAYIKGASELNEYVGNILRVHDAFTKNCDGDFHARNRHMAGRLLDLAQQGFQCILVVIGLAHWPAIRRLLLEGRTPPLAVEDSPLQEGHIEPIVLSPQIAAAHMGRFPAMCREWQVRRSMAIGPYSDVALDQSQVFREVLEEARQACADSKDRKRTLRQLSPREAIHFERFLANYSTLRNERVPRLNTILSAARTTAEWFVPVLFEALMRYPWLRPRAKNEPRGLNDMHYPVLQPASPGGRSQTTVYLGGKEYDADVDSVPLVPGAELENYERKPPGSFFLRTWVPQDRAATIVALACSRMKAIRFDEEQEDETVPFREVLSMQDGLDVRQTIRNMARGEPLPLEVREFPPPTPQRMPEKNPAWPYPVVYIFSDDRRPNGVWTSWYAPLGDAHGRPTGDKYHGIVGVGRTESLSLVQETTWQVRVDFCPVIWGIPDRHRWQAWIEKHWNEIPIGPSSEIISICPWLGEGPSGAHDALRLALQHSAGHASVILPNGSRLVREFHQIAKDAGKTISIFPASDLPADLLGRIRVSHLVAWRYRDPVLWQGGVPVPGVEAVMGESVDHLADVDFGVLARPQV